MARLESFTDISDRRKTNIRTVFDPYTSRKYSDYILWSSKQIRIQKRYSNWWMTFEVFFCCHLKKKTLKKTCMFFMCQNVGRSKRRFGGQRWFFFHIFSVFEELVEKVYEKYLASTTIFHIDFCAYITCFLYWYICIHKCAK